MANANGHYTYYPGCSLQSMARAYDISTKRVVEALGITFDTVEDWNCCGATEYFALNALPAYSLVARNLALAAAQGNRDLIAPCSLCYLNLYKTDRQMREHQRLNQQVNRALQAGGQQYQPGTLRVRHLLDMIVEDIERERIAERITVPLTGLRIAPYYGCLVTRPYSAYNPEYPTHLDDLMRLLGATPIDFPLKTHCCGGHMTQISEEVAYELIRRILKNAADYKADLIVTICPMCQLNLDAYQGLVNRTFETEFNIPVLFFTQLMGLAFGLEPASLGIGTEILDAAPALARIGQVEPEAPRRQRRDKQALPMPPMGRGE
ncbi:MAG: CoB--CoM heterodisulfide reductase iron-sulfur subunit B family protein [Aggregatilineales bacterium]